MGHEDEMVVRAGGENARTRSTDHHGMGSEICWVVSMLWLDFLAARPYLVRVNERFLSACLAGWEACGHPSAWLPHVPLLLDIHASYHVKVT